MRVCRWSSESGSGKGNTCAGSSTPRNRLRVKEALARGAGRGGGSARASVASALRAGSQLLYLSTFINRPITALIKVKFCSF